MWYNKYTPRGFSTLLIVLIISAVSLTTVFSLYFLTNSTSQTTGVYAYSYQAKSLADACVEHGLMMIRNQTNYSGSGSLLIGDHTCIYSVINTGGVSREIRGSATSSLVYKKTKATISQISPKIIINSWQEVNNF